LLRKLHLPLWYAGLAALGITFLSPQMNRLTGHFALAHIWFFPLLLLLLARYEERYSRRYQSLLIGILVWLSAQIHFYYFGLAALFLGLYTVFQIAMEPTGRNLRVRLSHLVVMVLLPFMALNVWVHWSHFTPDRPDSPYGFTYYVATWEGVFLPYENFPLFRWIDRLITPVRRADFEGQQYVGMVGAVFTLWVLFSRFRLFGRSWDEAAYHRVHRRFLIGIFVASSALLLFAFGLPFVIDGLEGLVDYIGPLKQFRGLGRFSWAFYYVINVLAFYAFWNYARRFEGLRGGRWPWLRHVILWLPLAVIGWQAFYFQKHEPVDLSPNVARRDLAAPTADHWLNKVDFSPYQAILPLPYYHVGSENLWIDLDVEHFRRTQLTAYHTATPDMGVNLSRTPLGETVKSVQLVLDPLTMPGIAADLPDDRPLALFIDSSRWDEVQRRHAYLLMRAQPVFENAEVKIMALSPDSLRPAIRQYHRWVVNDRIQRQPVRIGAWETTRPDGFFYHQSCDSIEGNDRVFQGKGSFSGVISDSTWLWRRPLPKGQYQLTLWIHGLDDGALTHELKIIETHAQDGRRVWFTHEGLRFHLIGFINGWALIDVPFSVREDGSRVDVCLQKDGVRQRFYLDEWQIRQTDTWVYRPLPGWIVRNNYWFDLQ
jgi:hypothetical protein